MSLSSSDRERWLQAVEEAQRRRRVAIAVGVVVALVIGLVAVRMGAVHGAGELLERVAVAAQAEPPVEAAESLPEPAAPAPRRPARPAATAPPAVAAPAPGMPRIAGEPPARAAADAEAPYRGPVVEIGLSTPTAPPSYPARLRNGDEISRLLRDHYPAQLRFGGYGGTVVVGVLVDEAGGVHRIRVSRASQHAELNAAAREVAAHMRFSPEQRLGRLDRTWVEVPLVFMP